MTNASLFGHILASAWFETTWLHFLRTVKNSPVERKLIFDISPITVTSLYDKNMIDKSEYLKGKYKLLGRKEEKARLPVAQGQYVVSDTLCPALHDCEFE